MADHSVYELTDSEPHIAEYRRTTKTINRTMVAFIAVLVVVVAALAFLATAKADPPQTGLHMSARCLVHGVHEDGPWLEQSREQVEGGWIVTNYRVSAPTCKCRLVIGGSDGLVVGGDEG